MTQMLSLRLFGSLSGLLAVLAVQTAAAQSPPGTIIYEAPGIIVEVPHFACNSARGNRRASILAEFDPAVASREESMAPNFEMFVRDKVYPGFVEVCGDIEIDMVGLSMLRKGDTRNWDSFGFAISDGGQTVIRRQYTASENARASMTVEEYAAMMPQDETGPGAEPDHGEVLLDDGKITIYADSEPWCDPRNYQLPRPPNGPLIDVVVPVGYGELQGWLQRNYGAFELSTLQPLLQKHECMETRLRANFYEQGATAYMETVGYGLHKDSAFAPEVFKVLSRRAGQTQAARVAMVEEEKKVQEIWGVDCNGAFCGLPGGAYLQAILANDAPRIRALDARVKRAVQLNIAARVGLQRADFAYSLLPALADTYFDHYADKYLLQCPNGLVSKTYSYTHETYDLPEYEGLDMGAGGGGTDSKTYALKPGFVPLCDRICDAYGGNYDRLALRASGSAEAIATLQGLLTITERFRCDSDAVELFELNLIQLTHSYLDERDASGGNRR